MRKRLISTILATALLAIVLAPAAIAADLTDIGYMDQAQVGSLPAFASANAQLAAYQNQLNNQFKSAMNAAKSDADKQRITAQFQQEFTDKQTELIGPLFQRAQIIIANIAAAKKLSVVVDKRIVVYGGVDITNDVIAAMGSPRAVTPPQAAPAASEIGFVDESALDSAQKVKDATDALQKFATQQQPIYAQRAKDAKSDIEKQQIAADFQKAVQAKREALLNPLVDATKTATANVARSKNLLLVVDRADIVFGGTDITQDVQNALNK
ncbi:MAG TPA: OmpH family outer membrane protein [Candidatus Baltobacteraceae bacterium]|nr:OmpH family outer membrane protein [Candidatus Baltobacteraceae bacterium]